MLPFRRRQGFLFAAVFLRLHKKKGEKNSSAASCMPMVLFISCLPDMRRAAETQLQA
jgi:hypothetical protein